MPRRRSGPRERDQAQTGTGNQNRAGKGCGLSGCQIPRLPLIWDKLSVASPRTLCGTRDRQAGPVTAPFFRRRLLSSAGRPTGLEGSEPSLREGGGWGLVFTGS